MDKDSYFVNARHTGNAKTYNIDEIDVFACHIFDTNTWYLVPNDGNVPQTMTFYPHRDDRVSRYDDFEDNWGIFWREGPLSVNLKVEDVGNVTVYEFEPSVSHQFEGLYEPELEDISTEVEHCIKEVKK